MASKNNIWSTKKIDEIVRNYNETGVIPADNPFYMGDMSLRDAKIAFEYTDSELREMAKVADDIIYYGENYAKVMTDAGIRTVKLRDYQIKVLKHFVAFRYTVYLASRQIGKCVTFDTRVTIKDGDNISTLPFYKVHYLYKKKMKTLDKLEYFLCDILYFLKTRIDEKTT